MWSVVALMLLRRVPLPWAFAIALGLFFWSYLSDAAGWREPVFADRVARLLVFLLLGLVAMPVIGPLATRWKRFWPVAVLAFFALALRVHAEDLYTNGVVRAVASPLGIAAVVLLSAWLAGTRAGPALAWLGRSSLYVFLLHRIVLFGFEAGFHVAGIEASRWTEGGVIVYTAIAAVAILSCAVAGQLLVRTGLGAWLFEARFETSAPAKNPRAYE